MSERMVSNPVGKCLRYVVIVVGGLLVAAPLFYLISASLMSASDVVASPPHLLPPSVVWSNYSTAFDFLTVRTVVNSLIFSLGVVFVQLVLAVPAGFALAKMPIRRATLLLAVILVPAFLPSNVNLIPLYIVTRELHLLDTYAGMILPIAGQTALAMFLFRQFFSSLPDELIEAARIDGAGWVNILLRIAVPLIKPSIAAYISVTFLTAWNMYIWPQVVASDPEHTVMTTALAPLARGQYSIISPAVGLAAAAISMVPVLLVFVFLQRWFIQGIVGSGVD